MACLHPAEADIRSADGKSRFDPTRTSGHTSSCGTKSIQPTNRQVIVLRPPRRGASRAHVASTQFSLNTALSNVLTASSVARVEDSEYAMCGFHPTHSSAKVNGFCVAVLTIVPIDSSFSTQCVVCPFWTTVGIGGNEGTSYACQVSGYSVI